MQNHYQTRPLIDRVASAGLPVPPQMGQPMGQAAAVRELCRVAQRRGCLTTDDIHGALPEPLLAPENLEAIYSQLREHGVEIVEASDLDPAEELKTEEEGRRLRLDSLDDPLRLYLNDVRRMRSLTHKEEIGIFQHIEEAENELRQVLFGLGFIAQEHLALAEKLLADAPGARMDRVVCEAQLQCRDDYLLHLADLVKTVRELDAKADRDYAAFQKATTRVERERWFKRCQGNDEELRRRLEDFRFRPEVAQEMILVAEQVRRELLVSFHVLIVAETRRQKRLAGRPVSEADESSEPLSPREAFQRVQALQRRVRMPASNYFQACARLNVLAAEADRGKHEMVMANLRLVVHVAKRYTHTGLPFLDLIQEGNVGLMKTVERFDYRRGFRFCTFAMWGIREAIVRSIANQGRLIRIPVHLHTTIGRLMSAQKRLLQDLGRDPTADEIADELGLPVARVRADFPACQQPVSLQAPTGEKGDSCLGDAIEDESVEQPGMAGGLSQIQEALAGVLASLGGRERQVLELRFGLGGNQPITLEEAGRKLGVTRERIRQIETSALRKMRHPSRSRKLLWTAEPATVSPVEARPQRSAARRSLASAPVEYSTLTRDESLSSSQGANQNS